MFGISKNLMNCGILTSEIAEYKNSALLPNALKQALELLCDTSWLKILWHLVHVNNKHAKVAHVLAVELGLQCRLI
jgi:hypothetical protein